jgi:hypothetical protein
VENLLAYAVALPLECKCHVIGSLYLEVKRCLKFRTNTEDTTIAESTLSYSQDWAEDKADDAKDEADNLASKTKHAAGDAGEWVEDRADDAKDLGKDAAKNIKGTAKDAKRAVGHAADDAADALKGR